MRPRVLITDHDKPYRPADLDEARDWQWWRIRDLQLRGRYACTQNQFTGDCTRDERICCEGDELVRKPGWRIEQRGAI